MLMNDTLTAVPGLRVGHYTDTEHATGCTVVLCPAGTVGGVDVRGGAPGTRETDLLRSENYVEEVNAVFLSGGSAYGLAVGSGVMRYLEAQGQGYQSARGFIVPIVPGAILMDLGVGSSVRPDENSGYAACEAATDAPVPEGSVGAGTGAICGAFGGTHNATKGGIGSAAVDLGDGLIVAALVAVNAVGDVVDEQGSILAGYRAPDGSFVGMLNALRTVAHTPDPRYQRSRENTVIGVVATNARLTKREANRVASAAHDGIAQAVRPAHTLYDGDTLFALATGQQTANVAVICAFAAEVVARAIRRAVLKATSLAGVRACRD